MTWFESLFGFTETPDNIKKHIVYDRVFDVVTSTANGKSWSIGKFLTIFSADIRHQDPTKTNALKLSSIVGDVIDMHGDTQNAWAVFQVASQTNCLEMVHDGIRPSDGITRYIQDSTQGPACAMSCAAGTLYRNYFEQTDDDQIDLFDELFDTLGLIHSRVSTNGYVKLSASQRKFILNKIVETKNLDYLKSVVKVGVHPNIEVNTKSHSLTQVYCSAIPVFSSDTKSYEKICKIVLEGAYDATLKVAVCNMQAGRGNKVFLTLLGGGAFKNPHAWILDSMKSSLIKFKDYDLDVKIVSRYGASNDLLNFIDDFNGELAELV